MPETDLGFEKKEAPAAVPSAPAAAAAPPTPNGQAPPPPGPKAAPAELGIKPATDTVPAWAKTVPEKFRADTPEGTLEKLAASYTEMEKKLGSTRTTPAMQAPDLGSFLSTVGVKEDEIVRTWTEKGTLADDQYAKFAAAGVPRVLIDAHMSVLNEAVSLQGKYAETTKQAAVASAAAIAGGEEALAQARDWGAKNMPAEWLADWGKRVDADPKQYPDMIRLIQAEQIRKGGGGARNPIINGQPTAGQTPLSKLSEIGQANRAAAKGDSDAIRRLAGISLADVNKAAGF